MSPSQSAASTNEVRVAVIGLGRRWHERYREALTRARGRARVVAVCDAVAHRAEAEADRIGCEAAEGLTPLLDRPDVEAVFLLDPPWFGLWPLRMAVARGKAVFSAVGHRATLDELGLRDSDATDAPLPLVMTDLAGRFAPEMLRLRELLATELGPARRALLKGCVRPEDPSPADPPDPVDAAIDLIDRCRALVPSGPIDVTLARRSDRNGRRLRVVWLGFAGGTSARLSLVCDRDGPPPPADPAGDGVKLLVETERGHARIDRSGALHWSIGGEPEAAEPRPSGSATSMMVDHVLRKLRGEQSLAPDLGELRELERLSRVFEW